MSWNLNGAAVDRVVFHSKQRDGVFTLKHRRWNSFPDCAVEASNTAYKVESSGTTWAHLISCSPANVRFCQQIINNICLILYFSFIETVWLNLCLQHVWLLLGADVSSDLIGPLTSSTSSSLCASIYSNAALIASICHLLWWISSRHGRTEVVLLSDPSFSSVSFAPQMSPWMSG